MLQKDTKPVTVLVTDSLKNQIQGFFHGKIAKTPTLVWKTVKNCEQNNKAPPQSKSLIIKPLHKTHNNVFAPLAFHIYPATVGIRPFSPPHFCIEIKHASPSNKHTYVNQFYISRYTRTCCHRFLHRHHCRGCCFLPLRFKLLKSMLCEHLILI